MRLQALFLLSCAFAPSVISATFEELAAQAAAAREAEKVPEAILLYRDALQLKPDWEEGWWFAGILSYESDQYADGRQAFTRLVAVNPKSAPGWAFLGLCEFETGAYGESLEHIQRGLGLSKGVPPETEQVLRFHEALLLTRQRRFDQARRSYRAFVQRKIQNPMLTAGIGLNALELPLLPAEVRPGQQDLVLMAGNTAYLWMSGDTAKTEEAFRSLIDRYPAVPGVHYLFATYLLSSNREEPGTAELKRELEVNPKSAAANGTMALVLVLAGKAAAALTYAKKAAEDQSPSNQPPSPRVLYAYGLALYETGELAQAIERLEAAEGLDPGSFECHLALAGAYSKAGRHDDARRERRTSIAMAKGMSAGNEPR